MTKYQYQLIQLSFDEVEANLNNLGSKGWRVVSSERLENNDGIFYTLLLELKTEELSPTQILAAANRPRARV